MVCILEWFINHWLYPISSYFHGLCFNVVDQQRIDTRVLEMAMLEVQNDFHGTSSRSQSLSSQAAGVFRFPSRIS